MEQHPLPIDLRRHAHARLRGGSAWDVLWTQDEDGCGGLPVGSAGKTLLLLSGGIDSPVAGHLAQRRGCELESIYFHSPPFVPQKRSTRSSSSGRSSLDLRAP